MNIIGVDPGASGALALLDWRDGYPGRVIEVVDTPTKRLKKGTWLDERALYDILTNQWGEYENLVAFIEQVNAHATPSSSAAFSFGGYFHSVRTLLGVCGVPYELITPGEWKKVMKVQGKGPKGKELSINKAKQLFPTAEKTFLKSKDGRADAALIAVAGGIRYNG